MKIAAIIATAALASLFIAPVARADSDACGDQSNQSISSEYISPESGEYNVYAKMSMPGQSSQITGYLSTDSCQAIGSTIANGTTWSQLGSIDLAGTEVAFELNGTFPGANAAAAKPQILLVPTSMPCKPAINCDTMLDGNAAYLSPVALTASTSGLIVEKVVDPARDNIKEVQYYADGQLMYTTPSLKPFDMTYADYYQQSIARVVVYKSKQRAVLQDTVPSTYLDSVLAATIRMFTRHSTMLITISIGLTLTLLLLTARAIARHYEEMAYFNYAHGLGRKELTPFQASFKTIVRNPTFRLISNGVAVLFVLVTAIVLTNVFIIAPYRVDGISMYATLQDKQLMSINKLPVTLSHQFKPIRGQVIIFHPNYGNLAYSDLRVDNILVKRVVGLPGERIISENGRLKVYSADHPTGYYVEATEPWGGKVTIKTDDEPFDITLTNDQVFVAGDNRPHSIDSRINGALPLSEVIGVVVGY